MLSDDSPFLKLPLTLDRKQALFLDGIRHAAEIVELSYGRLCNSLTAIALNKTEKKGTVFTHVFLDAWAFVDSTDRLRSLWEHQPNSKILPHEYFKSVVKAQLQSIRDIRNVSAHIAQKIDQIVALNASALGSINWITLESRDPRSVSTNFIRPGIMNTKVKGQFSMPTYSDITDSTFYHGSGHISLSAGSKEANLTKAYHVVREIMEYAEEALSRAIAEYQGQAVLTVDLYGHTYLDIGNS